MRQLYGADAVGIVLQSYLRRRDGDLERLLSRGSRVRLVKGGYWEPSEIVYRRRADIEGAFRRDMDLLLTRGRHPAIATHDAHAIHHARRIAAEAGAPQRGV